MCPVADPHQPPHAADQTPETPSATPVNEALSILTRAQSLADQLRADASTEVGAVQAEAALDAALVSA